VRRAEAAASRLGFTASCLPEVGRLLHVLAGERGRARVGEIGTGAGVGAAWIVSALDPAVQFLTCEPDPRLAAAAADLFRDDPNVRVLHGGWKDALVPEAPFDLLFVDGGGAKADPAVVGMLAPQATAVVDDLTPGRPGPDPVRELWLGHPDLAAVEILTTPSTAAIVAVRSR
jgi:predicted O-methyltransferase YrrM